MSVPIQILLIGHEGNDLAPFELALGKSKAFQYSIANDLEGALLDIAQHISMAEPRSI